MLDNANLIRKTRFPRQLVPLSVVFTHVISSRRCSCSLLVLNFIVLPRVRATEWLAIPLAVLFVGFVAGSALVASLNVLFRDVEFSRGAARAVVLPDAVLYGLDRVAVPSTTASEVIHWVNPLSPPVQASRAALCRDCRADRCALSGRRVRVSLALGALSSRASTIRSLSRSEDHPPVVHERLLALGRPGRQPLDLAFGSSGGSSDGQTSGSAKRGLRPPPGCLRRSSGSRRLSIDAADGGVPLGVQLARARRARRRRARRPKYARALATRRAARRRRRSSSGVVAELRDPEAMLLDEVDGEPVAARRDRARSASRLPQRLARRDDARERGAEPSQTIGLPRSSSQW